MTLPLNSAAFSSLDVIKVFLVSFVLDTPVIYGSDFTWDGDIDL